MRSFPGRAVEALLHLEGHQRCQPSTVTRILHGARQATRATTRTAAIQRAVEASPKRQEPASCWFMATGTGKT